MAISYGQFTLWVSVSYVVKSEPSCTSHKPRASYQRWLVRGDLQHEICPHAATQSYTPLIKLIPYLLKSTDLLRYFSTTIVWILVSSQRCYCSHLSCVSIRICVWRLPAFSWHTQRYFPRKVAP